MTDDQKLQDRIVMVCELSGASREHAIDAVGHALVALAMARSLENRVTKIETIVSWMALMVALENHGLKAIDENWHELRRDASENE